MQSYVQGDERFALIVVGPDGRVLSEGTGTGRDRDSWSVIIPRGVRLHPTLRQMVLREAIARPDTDLYYGDEVAPRIGQNGYDIILKPELDLALLIADDYIGLPLIVRSSAMRVLGGLRRAAKSAACYDLVLRAISLGLGVGRIAEVLGAHEHTRPKPAIADRLGVLRTWLSSSGALFDIGNGLVPGTLALNRRFTSIPDVTLIIPTRQSHPAGPRGEACGQPFVIDLLKSITRTDYPLDKIHILIGDDVDNDRIYSGQPWPFNFRRLVTNRPDNRKFNYAAKMNKLWRAAETELIVFMNDDIVVTSANWLRSLLTFSMNEDVGGVGARLLYPDGTIQHAGIPGGLFDFCAHAWLGQPASASTYQNWALVHREWSIVSGAIFATRKSVMDIVNGFDERFSLEFNDVDLCLRLRMLGYRIVYTPFAEFAHYEKASRGQAQRPGSELALFLKRWGEFLQQDPAYHPLLTRDSFQIRPVRLPAEWWQPSTDTAVM